MAEEKDPLNFPIKQLYSAPMHDAGLIFEIPIEVVLLDINPEIMRPGIESPLIRPMAVAARVAEMPASVASGIRWTLIIWRDIYTMQNIESKPKKAGLVTALLKLQPRVVTDLDLSVANFMFLASDDRASFFNTSEAMATMAK